MQGNVGIGTHRRRLARDLGGNIAIAGGEVAAFDIGGAQRVVLPGPALGVEAKVVTGRADGVEKCRHRVRLGVACIVVEGTKRFVARVQHPHHPGDALFVFDIPTVVVVSRWSLAPDWAFEFRSLHIRRHHIRQVFVRAAF